MALGWSACAVLGQSVSELQSEAAAERVASQSESEDKSERKGIERHGWAVLPMGDRFALVHLPPRSEVVGSDGFSADASDGELALVKELSRAPERVVSSGRTVFLIFEPQGNSGDVPRRSVLSVTAQPVPIGGRWSTDSDGRLRGRAGIAGSRGIIDAVGFQFTGGSQDQCAVLLAEASRESQSDREGQSMIDLLVLDGNVWASVALPTGLAATDRARLVASEDGLVLMALARDGSGWVGWRGTVTPGVTTFPEPAGDRGERLLPVRSLPTVHWATMSPWAESVIEDDARILEIDGSIVTSHIAQTGRWEVRSFRSDAIVDVISLEARGRALAFVATGVGSGTRLVLMVSNREGQSSLPSDGSETDTGSDLDAQKLRSDSPGLVAGLRLIEVSGVTGRVLYDGPSHHTALISTDEYLLLIVMLVAAVVGVLVFVLLPDPDDAVVTLPEGAALAEPFRRVAASMADVALATILASWVLEFVMDSGQIGHTPGDLWTLALTLLFAYTHGVLGEWALGRTLGKLLLGCQVVGTRRPDSSGVGLRQALSRNLVKFAMAPIAFMGLSDANGRHRGDVLAGTVVVIWIADETGDDSEDEVERNKDGADEAESDEESSEHSN